MPKKSAMQDTVEKTTLAEIFSRGPSIFCCPPPKPAFEVWWENRCNKQLKGKALAKAAFDAAIKEMCDV
jgi:hypothetical protein